MLLGDLLSFMVKPCVPCIAVIVIPPRASVSGDLGV